MSADPVVVKSEFKEEKVSLPVPSQEYPRRLSTQTYDNVPEEVEETGVTYICGNCTTQVHLTRSAALQCPSCEYLTGSSTVFYKLRTRATTYDTI
ncbi:RNA polymerase subunit [Strigomonas culicis]|uniref:RNA polymerase subunit n=1 Tax=Strigomonas culicis TaxID=28005 RepID=S9UJN5_9TRYP|nr:RNA polymerase subunit [Strigomonas culicis]|eukprot:EPY31027.1 RNA polymerase subunit [Strigomonas culicis]